MTNEDLRHTHIIETIWGNLPEVLLRQRITNSAPDIVGNGNELAQVAKEMMKKNPIGWNVFGGTLDVPISDGKKEFFEGIPLSLLFERVAVGGLVGSYEDRGSYGVIETEVGGTNFPVAIAQNSSLDLGVSLVALRQKLMGDGPDYKLEKWVDPRITHIYDWKDSVRSSVGYANRDLLVNRVVMARNVVVGSSVQSDYAFCNDFDGWRPYELPNQYYLIDQERQVSYLFADAVYLWG